jgi:hypothetical protein
LHTPAGFEGQAAIKRKMKMAVGIDCKNVKPGAAGVLFLVKMGETGDGLDLYTARFVRVRVVMGAINMSDMGEAHRLAEQLQADGLPYLAFSAGRNTPLPEAPNDERGLMAELEKVATFKGAKH